MIIHKLTDGDTVHKYNQCIVVLFSGKRHVISTGPNNGGYREDLQAVFNQDANPGPGMPCVLKGDTYESHMNVVALEDLGLPPDRCSGLCTAASMENASIQSLSFRNLTVTAIVTAGIEHNGGRAGDPATFYEEKGSFQPVAHGPGTINIIVHTNASLSQGALARTLITVSEAKCVALQELMVPSHNSSGLATGSGTDGIISICNPSSPLALTNAGKNSKLGELIGKTVKAAVKESLLRQTGLCPDRQRNILRIMGRFGIDRNKLWEKWNSCHENGWNKAVFMDRLDRIKAEPKLVEASFLVAHVLDLLAWELIDDKEASSMVSEILGRIKPGVSDSWKNLTDSDNSLNPFLQYENWLFEQIERY